MNPVERRKALIVKIKETILEAKKKGKEVIDETLILELSVREGVSRRTAMDYIKSARYLVEISK